MKPDRIRAGLFRGRWKSRVAAGLAMAWLPGCAGDARVELAAADSMDSLAAAFDVAFQEYHGEVEAADDAREGAVIAAFVQRVAEAGEDPAERERHVGEFTEALERIRADRRTEWSRFAASQENVAAMREVTAGLRRLAIESLTLSDEARRYLMSLVDAARLASASSSAAAGKETANVGRSR